MSSGNNKSVVQELASEQRTYSQAELDAQAPQRYDAGKSSQAAHNDADPKDERSIANRLEATSKRQKEEDKESEQKLRPTQIAEQHGNKPSKGAIIDEQLQAEDEAELRKKGIKTD